MFDLMPFEHRGRNLFNFFDDFEKNFFGDLSTDFAQFRTDILDKGDHYLLQAELPGFHKEDINIDLSDNALTIRAEHNEQNDEKDDKGNYIRRERKYGSFVRSFSTEGINPDAISAEYNNGVLELKLPKQALPEPQSRKSEVK